MCVCMCVCVCVRERERERGVVEGDTFFNAKINLSRQVDWGYLTCTVNCVLLKNPVCFSIIGGFLSLFLLLSVNYFYCY